MEKRLKNVYDTFKSFILEGNVNDLQPVELASGIGYVSLDEAIAELYSQDYCVVFYDHTKQSGKPIEDNENSDDDDDDDNEDGATQSRTEEIDDTWFNSFSFAFFLLTFSFAKEKVSYL